MASRNLKQKSSKASVAVSEKKSFYCFNKSFILTLFVVGLAAFIICYFSLNFLFFSYGRDATGCLVNRFSGRNIHVWDNEVVACVSPEVNETGRLAAKALTSQMQFPFNIEQVFTIKHPNSYLIELTEGYDNERMQVPPAVVVNGEVVKFPFIKKVEPSDCISWGGRYVSDPLGEIGHLCKSGEISLLDQWQDGDPLGCCLPITEWSNLSD